MKPGGIIPVAIAPAEVFAGTGLPVAGAGAAPAGTVPASPSSLLEVLRDVQMPVAISWWPPAPGWWVLSSIAVLAYFQWRHAVFTRWFRRQPPSPFASVAIAAHDEMAELRRNFDESRDVYALVSSLSVLLRRISMEFFPREEVASLTDEAWLKWLDEQIQSDVFSSGVGRVLADAPYRKPDSVAATVDGEALLKACEGWMMALVRRSTE